MTHESTKMARLKGPASVRAVVTCAIVALAVIVIAVVMIKPWAGPVNPPDWTPGLPTMSELPKNLPVPIAAPALPGAKAYGGSYDDEFSGVAVGQDGSVVAAGYTQSSDGDFPQRFSWSNSATMIMAHPDGRAWAQVYGGGGGDKFRAVAAESDGSVIVAGESWSELGDFPQADGGYALVAKINSDGTLAWATRFGSNTDRDGLSDVAVGADGRIVVAGYVDSYNGNLGCVGKGWCGILAEVTAGGDQVWQKTYPNGRSFSAIAMTADGNIVAVGSDESDTCPTTDYYCSSVMMTDPAGNVLWTKILDESGWETLNGISVAPDGSIVAVGAVGSSAIAVKLTADGQVEWSNMFLPDQSGKFDAVAVNSDGGIVAVGQASEYSSNSRGGLVALISPSGELTWSKTFGISGDTEFTCVATSPNQIVVGGNTTSPDGAFANTHGTNNKDAVLMRLTPDGQLS